MLYIVLRPVRSNSGPFSTAPQKPLSSRRGQSQMALPAQTSRSVGVLPWVLRVCTCFCSVTPSLQYSKKRLNQGQHLRLLRGQRQYHVLWARSFMSRAVHRR